MEGIQWDKIPDDIREQLLDAQSAEAGAMAEGMELNKRYGDLMALYQQIESRNEEFKRYYCTRPDENLGDI